MSDQDPPRGFVVGDRQPPEEEELILDGIRFMREELGIVSDELPTTYAGAKYLYEELIAKLEPPNPSQIARINRLVAEVGGTVSGQLHSRRHAALLIRELKRVRKNYRAYGVGGRWLAPTVAATVTGILVGLALWPERTAGLLLLIGGVAFVVGGAVYVLGLWMDL